MELVRDLFALSKNTDALNIMSNIITAALHLACMLNGTYASAQRLVSLYSRLVFMCYSIVSGRAQPADRPCIMVRSPCLDS